MSYIDTLMQKVVAITYNKYLGNIIATVTFTDERKIQYMHVKGTAFWDKQPCYRCPLASNMPVLTVHDVPTILRDSLITIVETETQDA